MATPYDAILDDEERRLKQAQPQANPYEAIVNEEAQARDNRLTGILSAATKVNPDKAAQANTLSRRTGIPVPVVERNAEQIEAIQRAKELRDALAVSPMLQQQMFNPEFAKIAHDDGAGLSTVERIVRAPWKAVQAIAAGAVPSVAAGAYGVLAAPFEVIGQYVESQRERRGFGSVLFQALPENIFAKTGQGLRRASSNVAEYAKRVADLDPEAGLLERGVTSGLQSLGQNIPALVGAVVTGNPGIAIGGLSALAGGQEYTKAREKGLEPTRAAIYGAGQGAVEAVTEKFAWTKFLGDLKVGTPFFKMLLNNQVREQPGEQVATVLQDLNEWGTLNPEKPFSDYVKERPSAALETAIATLVAGGGNVVLAKAMEREGMVARTAEEAQIVADKLNDLMAAAANSKLRERSPETFRDFVNAASEDSELPAVWVNAQTLQQTLMQSGVDLTQVQNLMPETVSQFEEALAMNREVRIPTGELAALAGSGIEAAIIPHLRTAEDQPTLNEVQEFYQSQASDMEKMAEKVMAESEQRDAMRESAAAVEAKLLTQFREANRFTDDVNTAYARLATSFYTVQAARLNMTPEEMYAKYPLQVRASSVAGGDVQMDQESPEFKAWFGESKVRDAQGKPLVVYHGPGQEGIETFNTPAYFTADKNTAAGFGSQNGIEEPIAAYLSLKNPFIVGRDDALAPWLSSSSFQSIATKQKLQALGFDGIIGEMIGSSGLIEYVAFDPTQIKSAVGNRGAYDPNDPNILNQPLSTRVPTAVKATEDALGDRLIIGLEAMQMDGDFFKKAVDVVTKYVNFPKGVRGSAEKKAEVFIEQAVSNLLWLYDQVPEATRERSKKWYDGARVIIDGWNALYGLDEAQIAGVIAVMSPQKDWFQNVSVAERVLDVMLMKQNERWDDAMSVTAERIYAKPEFREHLDQIRGKTLGELDLLQHKAMWVRAYSETYHTRAYRKISPEGDFIEWNTNADGVTKSSIQWGSLAEIGKAISIIEDGSIPNISLRLGENHKVRNFYNNMFNPQDGEHVTIDTHAVAAALLRPLAASDTEVGHNFGTSGAPKTAVFGAKGTYGLYAEAYRRAAAQRGVLTREMQSITWEAIRGLFTNRFKAVSKNGEAVNSVWQRYRNGEVSLDDARNEIIRYAGGINAPQWESSDGSAGAGWASTYDSELSGSGVSERRPTGDGRTAGRGSARRGRGSGELRFEQSGLQRGGASGDGSMAAAQESARTVAAGAPVLIGLPQTPMQVAGEWYVPGPFGLAHSVARDYMDARGMPYRPPRTYAKVDVERARRIAKAFDDMKHDPQNPEVKAAYQAMIDETLAQWQAIKATGLKVEFIKGEDPYAASPRQAIMDVADNNHLWVFPTDAGFGSSDADVSGNPLLALTDEVIDGHRLRANDVFRIVHDYFGHIKDGNGFRAEGEENAWRSHAEMYSPLARRAMTTETRGQNSWVNFGPHGEKNRTASSADTVYADQKIGLLPEWVSEEGRASAVPEHGEIVANSISVVGVHFSPSPRQALSSKAYGTGMRGAERQRVMSERDTRLRQRVHFYVNTGQGVFPEDGVGAVAHAVVLNGLYDADSDVLKLGTNESAILDAGFSGYVTRRFGNQGAVVLLGEQEVPVAPIGIKKDANAFVQNLVVPAPTISDERKLIADFVNDRRLPSGKMTPSEWLAALEKSAPDLAARVPRERFVGEQAVYRDEIARTFAQSPAFDKWFGGSKVVDDEGNPLVMYHGTRGDFTKFKPTPGTNSNVFGSWQTQRSGFFFTADKSAASEFAMQGERPVGANVMPVYLYSAAPIDLRNGFSDAQLNGLEERGLSARFYGAVGPSSMWELFDDEDGGAELVAALKDMGYDGARIVEPATGDNSVEAWVVFDASQIKSAVGNRGTFDPNSDDILEQPARGQISMAADITQSPTTITLLQNADLSTFLHEMGHFQLEVLAHIASQQDAPQEIVSDLNAVFKWFGVSGLAEWQAMTLEEKRPHHEKFARGFEAYLFEGKSPNQQLQAVFARFRAWMLNVYRELRNLDVQLTDEVRDVFNRLLASNEDILAAESARAYAPLFSSAKEMGATETEFRSYQELGRDATQDAVDNLQTRSLRDMQWTTNTRARTIAKLQKDAAEKRKAVRAEVKAEVEAQPIYQAFNFLSRGTLLNEDGTTEQAVGAKLSLDALREMYGDGPAAPWRYFNTGKFGLVSADAEGSLHPDMVAEMFGFGSGDALVRALLAADPQREVIEGMTDQRMLERYGDLIDQRSIERAANAAIHNEVRGRFIATELRALNDAMNAREEAGTDKKGRKRTSAVLPKAAREFAETLIARKRIREVRPAQYEAAEARAGKAAERALGKNLVEAATEKRNQLVNHYAARAAHQALEDVEKGVAYLKRVAESESIDIGYREQIQALLERFDLRRTTATQAARRKSLVEWVEDQRANGFEPVIDPQLLNEAQRTPYQDMSVEDFRGLVDAARNIAHLGRLKKKLLTARDKREFDIIVAEAAAAIHDNAKRSIDQPIGQTKWTKMKELKDRWFAFHRKFLNIVREMDGWKDNGVIWRLFGRGMNEAATREAVMREEATMKLHALLKPVLAEGRMGKRMEVWPGLSLSREERIMVALNMGNDGNKQRLLDGYGWTADQAQTIVNTLSKTDMDFVQSVWDFIGTYRAEIGAQQKRLTGIEPAWVEPTPVVTPHGEYKGGYVPVKYDSSRSTRSLSDEAAAGIMDQWRGARGSAKTRDSFTKARADKVVDRGLRLDFGVVTQHVTEVTHRLAWQEFLVDAQRLLRAKPIDQAIREHYGHVILETMRDMVTDVAAGEVPAQNILESAINYIRIGATIAGLGWRVTTSLLQPFGLTQSMVRIGPKWVGRGLAEFLGDAAKMENTAKRIYEKSDFMRLRGKTMQREMSEIRNVIGDSPRRAAVESTYFYLIQKMQLVADIPTWLGQYHKSVEAGLDEDAAIQQADQAVLDSQGGGQIKDLAGVQRGSPMMKLWTNFYSFFNTTYNLTKESVGRTDFKSALSVGRLAVDFLLLYSVPAALGTLMKDALSDDDDEEKLVRQLIADQLSYMLGTVVFLREAAGIFRSLSGLSGDYQGPAAVRLFGELQKLGKQIEQGEVDEGMLKAINNVGGLLFHYPAGQINATLDGIVSLSDGRTDHPGALLVGSSER